MSEISQLHLFAGKGGSGKTTLSTAFALHALDEHPKARILLLSLRPHEVVGDLLKKKIGTKPQKLVPGKGEGGLTAVELDMAAIGEAFQREWREAAAAMAGKGAMFSEDDVRKLIEASFQNMEEQALFFHLHQVLESGEWDSVVVDGPSFAQTVRFIDAVTQLRKQLTVLRGDHKVKASKNAPPRPATAVDANILRCDAVLAWLKDAKRFSLHLCTMAEPVAESQTKYFVKAMAERQIPIFQIVVDLIEERSTSREVSNRRGLQAPHVRKYQTLVPRVDLMGRRIIGPRGFDEVKKFGKDWALGKEGKSLAFTPAEAPPALVRAPSMPQIAAPPLPPTRFIFFVGSGGVGKTSCAAAAAVTLTEKEGPVLLLSTDPAHALSDVVLNRLTDTETQVKGTKGLYAREIDFQSWFNGVRKKLREAVEAMFGPDAKSEPFQIDREVLRHLIDFVPGGFEELTALATLTDALVQERFKRIVVDTMPASNVLRVVELIPSARAWFSSIQALATKYKSKGAELLMQLAGHYLSHVERFEKAIANPTECRFVVVTRGEELSAPAAERLVEYLKLKNLPVERVLVNRILPKTVDAVTEERRKNELEVAKYLEKRIGVPVTMAPALGRHPAGLRELKAFRTSWYATTAAPSKIKAAS